MMFLPRHLAVAALSAIAVNLSSAQVSLSGTTYSENFDSITSNGLPAGWSVYTDATSSSLGSAASFNTATKVSWGTSTGGFRNVASSTGLTSSSSSTDQGDSGNRALGIRQTSSFGDPGASFAFNMSTTGYSVTSINMDALMLWVQANSTTWTIDYGIGSTPTTFTALASYSDPGTWGSTALSITGSALTSLANQSSVWIRVSALTATTVGGTRDTFAIDNFSLTYAAVPEPSTYAAILGGVALVGVMVLRRHKAVTKTA